MDIRRKDEGGSKEKMSNEGGSAAKKTSGGKGVFGTIVVIIIVAALIGAGFYFARSGNFDIGGAGSSFDGPVATVNGQEIGGDQLSEQLQSLRNANTPQAQQFSTLSETDQQEILLEGIINTELQLQAARGAGVTVSDEEVEEQLQSSIDQIGQSEFENRLAQNDVTEDEVREDLRNQMIISAYIEQEAGGEITATDAEISELYQQYAAQINQASPEGQESQVPSLVELRPQIESAVIQQKQQETALRLLEQARANAEIEVLLEGVDYPSNINQQQTPPPTQPAPTQQPEAAGAVEGAADNTGNETEASAEDDTSAAEE